MYAVRIDACERVNGAHRFIGEWCERAYVCA